MSWDASSQIVLINYPITGLILIFDNFKGHAFYLLPTLKIITGISFVVDWTASRKGLGINILWATKPYAKFSGPKISIQSLEYKLCRFEHSAIILNYGPSIYLAAFSVKCFSCWYNILHVASPSKISQIHQQIYLMQLPLALLLPHGEKKNKPRTERSRNCWHQ